MSQTAPRTLDERADRRPADHEWADQPRSDQGQFADLLCSDPELIRTEFDALIAAAAWEFGQLDPEDQSVAAEAERPAKPPAGAPPRIEEIQPSLPSGPVAARARPRIGRADRPGTLRWRRPRSPLW